MTALAKLTVLLLPGLFASFCMTQAGEIHEAAAKGDMDRIRVLLLRNPDLVNSKDQNLYSPLLEAVGGDHKEAAELLLAKGANVNFLNGRSLPALHCAAARGNLSIVKLLLDHGADVNAIGGASTALHSAALYGKKDVAELLLNYGANINATNCTGQTSLFLALQEGHNDVASLLRERGATEDASIAFAIAAGNLPRVRKLIEGNPSLVSSRDDFYIGSRYSPLHWAARQGQTEIAELLITKGAEVDAKDVIGRTPLFLAVSQGHKTLVETLLINKADISLKVDNGWTLLLQAVENCHKEIVETLLIHGAEVNKGTTDGWTPLHHAARKGEKDIAEILLSHGANVNARRKVWPATPLQSAKSCGHTNIVELLREHGARE